MSINITLTEEQITDVLNKDTDLKYQVFRDSTGPNTIDENSIFPERLRFYMEKKGSNSSDVVTFFKANYPFLAKSTSTIQHYLNGVRTPGLSTVFALADFLDIAPAQLLPAKPGKYIEYRGDHVEMVEPLKADISPTDATDHTDHNVVIEEEDYIEGDPLTRENTDSTISEDIPTPVETNSYIENNNVVFQDSLEESPEEAIEEPTEELKETVDSIIDEANSSESEEAEANSKADDDDFDLDDLSDKQDQADQFLKDLFSESSSTPYDEYTKDNE